MDYYGVSKENYEEYLNKKGPPEGETPYVQWNHDFYYNKYGTWVRNWETTRFCSGYFAYKRRMEMKSRASSKCAEHGCQESWMCQECYGCQEHCLCLKEDVSKAQECPQCKGLVPGGGDCPDCFGEEDVVIIIDDDGEID